MSATTPSTAGGFAREATATPSNVDVDDAYRHLRHERFHTPLSATPSVLADLAGGNSSANRESTKSRGASRWVRERKR